MTLFWIGLKRLQSSRPTACGLTPVRAAWLLAPAEPGMSASAAPSSTTTPASRHLRRPRAAPAPWKPLIGYPPFVDALTESGGQLRTGCGNPLGQRGYGAGSHESLGGNLEIPVAPRRCVVRRGGLRRGDDAVLLA